MERRDITLVKLGGGLLTNKSEGNYDTRALNETELSRVAPLIAAHRAPLLLAHGNGSFGHTVARRHAQRLQGQPWDDEAAREVRAASRELNALVAAGLESHGVPVQRYHTEELMRVSSSGPEFQDLSTLEGHLDQGEIPLLYGAMVNSVRGYEVVSTEALLCALAGQWRSRVKQVLFFSKTPGVFRDQQIVPELKAAEIPDFIQDHVYPLPDGTADVTGAMATKLRMAGALAKEGIPVFIGHPSEEAFEGKPAGGTWVLPD